MAVASPQVVQGESTLKKEEVLYRITANKKGPSKVYSFF
jgi:hypothetical protein